MLDRLQEERLIAIVRASTYARGLAQAQALVAAGVSILEVSWTTPDAFTLLSELGTSRVVAGAGTILTEETARRAVAAGAQFLLAPNFSESVHRVAKEFSVPYIPGVWTASEVAQALAAGISVQKLFPAATGGIRHLKALAEPFPTVRFIPTGGVTSGDCREWIDAGAFAVGMGGSLASLEPDAIRNLVGVLRQGER